MSNKMISFANEAVLIESATLISAEKKSERRELLGWAPPPGASVAAVGRFHEITASSSTVSALVDVNAHRRKFEMVVTTKL